VEDISWPIVSAIVGRFVTVQSLLIRGTDFESFITSAVFPNVSHIKISNSNSVLVRSISQIFPNVEVADFMDNTYIAGQNQSEREAIAWPKIHSLRVYNHLGTGEVSGFPWDALRLSRLTTLSIDVDEPTIPDFVSRHSSLLHLDLQGIPDPQDSPNRVGSIVENAPQLHSLQTSIHRQLDYVISPLHNLSELFVYVSSFYDINERNFDRFIPARFKSRQREGGRPTVERESRVEATPSLVILGNCDDQISRWKSNKLINRAHMEVSTVELWGREYRAYRLSWSHIDRD
jgi:hypothetical protein